MHFMKNGKLLDKFWSRTNETKKFCSKCPERLPACEAHYQDMRTYATYEVTVHTHTNIHTHTHTYKHTHSHTHTHTHAPHAITHIHTSFARHGFGRLACVRALPCMAGWLPELCASRERVRRVCSHGLLLFF